MKVGVVAETKVAEGRVSLTPAGARELVSCGHEVLVERGAGARSGFPDTSYTVAGATLAGVIDVWAESEILLKVKEPLPEEYELLRPDLTLFTDLHLAAAPTRASPRPASW